MDSSTVDEVYIDLATEIWATVARVRNRILRTYYHPRLAAQECTMKSLISQSPDTHNQAQWCRFLNPYSRSIQEFSPALMTTLMLFEVYCKLIPTGLRYEGYVRSKQGKTKMINERVVDVRLVFVDNKELQFGNDIQSAKEQGMPVVSNVISASPCILFKLVDAREVYMVLFRSNPYGFPYDVVEAPVFKKIISAECEDVVYVEYTMEEWDLTCNNAYTYVVGTGFKEEISDKCRELCNHFYQISRTYFPHPEPEFSVVSCYALVYLQWNIIRGTYMSYSETLQEKARKKSFRLFYRTMWSIYSVLRHGATVEEMTKDWDNNLFEDPDDIGLIV